MVIHVAYNKNKRSVTVKRDGVVRYTALFNADVTIITGALDAALVPYVYEEEGRPLEFRNEPEKECPSVSFAALYETEQ